MGQTRSSNYNMPLFKKQHRELDQLLRTGNEQSFNDEMLRIEEELEALKDRKRAIRDERLRRQAEARQGPTDADQVILP
jgi:hypothetical protein